MGKKKKLIKVTDIVHIPGQPRFVVVTRIKNPKTKESTEYQTLFTLEPDLSLENKSPLNRPADVSPKEMFGLKIAFMGENALTPREIDRLYNKLEKELTLTKTKSKIYDAILKRDTAQMTGFIEVESRVHCYYLKSNYYDLPAKFEEIFGFLPYDELYEDLHDSVDILHNLLFKNPILLPVFLYSVLALTEHIWPYSTDSSFSLWLYGKQYTDTAKMANLLSNLFAYKSRKIYNRHRFHIDTAAVFHYNLNHYSDSFYDIPLLIFSGNQILGIKSKYVQMLIDAKSKSNIGFCPVFVASSSTRNKAVFPINLGSITMSESEFVATKPHINRIYSEFIDFICGILNTANLNVSNNSFKNSMPEITPKSSNERSQYISKLYKACHYYIFFLQKIGINTKDFANFASDTFKQMYAGKTLKGNCDTDTTERDIHLFLKEIADVIFEHLGDNPLELVRSKQHRLAPGKYCDVYEVDSKLFQDILNEYIVTPQRQFCRLLSDRNLIISAEHRFVHQRTINGSHRNVYLIPTKALNLE